jgi:hypothetical protein
MVLRADQISALLLVMAILVLPVLAYGVWRWVKRRAHRRAVRELSQGNKIYGAWRQSQQPPTDGQAEPNKR